MNAPAANLIAPTTGSTPTAEIRTDGLAKVYGERRVVDGVNVRFAGGEVVGLLGPNGAGKTTTFYMIVGLVAASEGRVCLDGADLTKMVPAPTPHRAIALDDARVIESAVGDMQDVGEPGHDGGHGVAAVPRSILAHADRISLRRRPSELAHVVPAPA